MTEPLVSKFGLLGTGTMVEAVAGGTYIPLEGTEGHMVDWLSQLWMVPMEPGTAARPPPWISTQSHMAGWSKAREAMVAGPSGLTTAHFKAGAQHPLIAKVDMAMANIPYMLGISSSHWWRGIDMLIPKKADDD